MRITLKNAQTEFWLNFKVFLQRSLISVTSIINFQFSLNFYGCRLPKTKATLLFYFYSALYALSTLTISNVLRHITPCSAEKCECERVVFPM